jgi:hypothetical protein
MSANAAAQFTVCGRTAHRRGGTACDGVCCWMAAGSAAQSANRRAPAGDPVRWERSRAVMGGGVGEIRFTVFRDVPG